MAVDSYIQLATDGSGKKLDTAIFNMGAGSTELHREKLIIADPLSTGGFATVTSSAGLSTVVTSGLVSITSGTVSLSSAPLVVVASSGGTQIVALSSSPLVVVASSGGTQLVQSTAATNPWSSAPGFNMPVVTVSSGLVQVSGTITSASSGLVQLSSAPLVVVASSGGTQLVQSTAGTNPWSSAPGFNLPVVSVSSGLVQISGTPTVLVTSSSVINIALWQGTSSKAPVYVVATTISKVSSSPGNLVSVSAISYINTTSAGSATVIRFYNATTSNVSVGVSVVAALPCNTVATSAAIGTGWGGITGPIGWGFPTACSFDIANTATGAVVTTALITGTSVTVLYTT